MLIWDRILNLIFVFLPSVFMVTAFGAALWGSHWFLIGRHPDLGNERKFPRQIFMLGLTVAGILAIVISLPINESFRNQIIGLIGIFLSGIIAFSSTNVIANFMAGILLRITKPFRTGDFIRVGDFFGRVSERGLFDTEIQSENRELIALPNTYLISNPVTTIRSSGAIISITLSLGYDVHHSQIEPLLIKAAEESGLTDPFVHIMELGNYAITYRISGLLTEVKGLITARSNLCRAALEILHSEGIEIMSPAFMNQRRIGDDQKIIPTSLQTISAKKTVDAEEIVFDKAEQAEQIEGEKQELIENIKKLKTALKETKKENKDQIKKDIEQQCERLKAFEQTEVASDLEKNTVEPIATTDAEKPHD